MKPLRILFLHPNFPGQFRHVSKALADDGHAVKFLCQTHYGRELPGVERICLKGRLSHEALETLRLPQEQRASHLAGQFRSGMKLLLQQGWTPNLVISHSGWGCGLHVKELWPEVRQISYVEWWFDPKSELLHFDPANRFSPLGPGSAASLWRRNQSMALELAASDQLVAPTEWQRQQLPESFRERCVVIFDGVDQNRFKPDPTKRAKQPVLTYGTRGMEAIRGFPEFIRELPAALRQHPSLSVQIAGEDRIHYGGPKPDVGSWGQWAKQLLEREGLGDRVQWKGMLNQHDYVGWLQSSWCHVYLTQPYVASWSLAEALCCGCPLIASDVPPVRELAVFGSTVLVDHRHAGFLLQPLKTLMGRGLQAPLAKLKERTPGAQQLDLNASVGIWRRVVGQKVATTA